MSRESTDIEKNAKKFNILLFSSYPSEIQNELHTIFDVVHVCKEKSEVYEVFQANKIDIVFIDVDDLNWIEIVHYLRQEVYDLPITIITDTENRDRLTTAITLGLTYIFKPIDSLTAKITILDTVDKLQNKRDAKELFYKKEQEKFNQVAIDASETIIKNIPYPMVVFNKEKILFANKELFKLFHSKNIKTIDDLSLNSLLKVFENHEELESFETMPNGRNFDMQLHYKDKTLKKVFIPTKSKVSITNEEAFVVVLNDIAPLLMQLKMMHYQQAKLTSYKELIEELLVKQVFKTNAKAIVESSSKQIKSLDDSLDDKDIKLLRKSVTHKIDAITFINELDQDSLVDVGELHSVEDDLQIAIDAFVMSPSHMHMIEISKFFNIYGGVVTSLMEFTDLGNAICSLSDFLGNLDDSTVRDKAEFISTLIESILQDLVQWRLNIFESQNTVDIHYLDSSIFSSILQLQVNISQEFDEEGNDLELF